MCNHSNRKKVNSVWVCLKCGLTVTEDGKVILDKQLPNYRKKRRASYGKKGK